MTSALFLLQTCQWFSGTSRVIPRHPGSLSPRPPCLVSSPPFRPVTDSAAAPWGSLDRVWPHRRAFAHAALEALSLRASQAWLLCVTQVSAPVSPPLPIPPEAVMLLPIPSAISAPLGPPISAMKIESTPSPSPRQLLPTGPSSKWTGMNSVEGAQNTPGSRCGFHEQRAERDAQAHAAGQGQSRDPEPSSQRCPWSSHPLPVLFGGPCPHPRPPCPSRPLLLGSAPMPQPDMVAWGASAPVSDLSPSWKLEVGGWVAAGWAPGRPLTPHQVLTWWRIKCWCPFLSL